MFLRGEGAPLKTGLTIYTQALNFSGGIQPMGLTDIFALQDSREELQQATCDQNDYASVSIHW